MSSLDSPHQHQQPHMCSSPWVSIFAELWHYDRKLTTHPHASPHKTTAAVLRNRSWMCVLCSVRYPSGRVIKVKKKKYKRYIFFYRVRTASFIRSIRTTKGIILKWLHILWFLCSGIYGISISIEDRLVGAIAKHFDDVHKKNSSVGGLYGIVPYHAMTYYNL